MNLVLQEVSLSLHGFDLRVDAHFRAQVTGIFGPSGAGKTTLLDLIAGLRKPRAGAIRLDGHTLTEVSTRTHRPARLRHIGYVPQDLALFPHLTVDGNIRFGHPPGTPADSLFGFNHVIDVLEIGGLVTRNVRDLSGGEKQRVALARALLASPGLLLLDEPLANLDQKLKARILPYLRRVRDEFSLPMIYVSHDAEEVAAICQEVWVMDRGQMVHRGPPETALNGD